MNLYNYQTNFDFSRKLDFQKNLNNDFSNGIFNNLVNNSTLRKNKTFFKHFNFILTELFFCWLESRQQFISVSMSKRGYNSCSRYNPNKISSYCIKIIQYMRDNQLVEFFPGFFDLRTNKSRLSRIRPKQKLINELRKISLKESYLIHHEKREFIFLYKEDNLNDYLDVFRTYELREILSFYNKIIQKNLFDVPHHETDNFKNFNGKLINLFISNSVLNCYFFETFDSDPIIGGCWWDKLDESLILKYKKNFSINNEKTAFIDLLDFLPDFLSFSLDNSIQIKKSNLDDLSYSEKCYILLRYIRSKNKKNFLHIILREKKRYGFDDYSNDELKKITKDFMRTNKIIFDLIENNSYKKWQEFCSKIFLELLKLTLDDDNPIYLVKDKIYFCLKHQKNVKTNLNLVLEKFLRTSSISIKVSDCTVINDGPKNFFDRLLKKKFKLTDRYLKNLKNYERKKNYGS